MSQHQGGWAREAHNTDDLVKFSSCPTLILRRTWFLKKCQCGWLSPDDLMSRCQRRRGGGTFIPATISARGTRATKKQTNKNKKSTEKHDRKKPNKKQQQQEIKINRKRPWVQIPVRPLCHPESWNVVRTWSPGQKEPLC